MSVKNGPHLPHYHNVIKSTNCSAVYTPSSCIISDPLTDTYTIGEHIGRGKFAVVKKCTHKQTGEVLAAKYIKKRRRGKSCREEIIREVVMLEMALHHPRLVNLKAVYETQQELILVTEYCAGGELFTECILEEKFDEADVRLLISQILEGIMFLHEKNIVHLDLKPQNILLTDEFPRGSVKICDLGFACLVNTGEDIRDIIGTPDYVAPEVLNYDSLGLYTDMWSLGVLTYVMLTTCSPFAADNKQMTFSNITTVDYEFPEDLFGDISIAAQDFIHKLLVSTPSERMTAKQCFDHEWLAGIINPSKALTNSNLETPNLTTGENQDISVQENCVDEAYDLNEVKLKSDNKTWNQPGESSREKIENQPLEMSVNENRDDEGVVLDTESDFKAHTQSEIATSETDTINKDSNLVADSRITDKPCFNEGRILVGANNVSSSDVTPDTDSSMCISDTRMQETDSGMVTGSECKSTESVNKSGRTSVDPEPARNMDANFNSETNDDIEMLNKSLVESESKDIGSKVLDHSTKVISEKINNKEPDKCDDRSVEEVSSENEMDVEQSDSFIEADVRQKNENNSAKSATFEKQHSSLESGLPCLESEMANPEINLEQSENENQDQSCNLEMSSPVFGDFLKDDKYATTSSNTDTKARSSVSNIDDSINSMQLGERLKRGMCNEPASSEADNIENDETEYEFVSVSKRVRSIEDASPSSPQFSPKIQRSPRIGKRSRNYHQHH